MQTTIDYGIDLGTTNSAIARQDGSRTEVIEGADGLLVPSVVYMAPNPAIAVGAEAVRLRQSDPANAAAEFKRLMGTAETISFPAANRSASPEELSAEVLKHLLHRAEARSGQSVKAAVITIPAMFQLPQCEATRRAATLAGLEHAPLLQEPIAAAIASAGSADLREGFWLIYDLGGGTFDVTLVRARRGRLQVVDHDGDNHLGGKDFDRLLVRRAAGAVRSSGQLGDFRRSDPALAPVFDRLKVEAERVRIALSQAESATFSAGGLSGTGGTAAASVEFPITREELEALIRPSIARTIKVCRDMLARNDLAPSQIKRLVLVGGPTLTPCLPSMIEQELEIEARHFVDPVKAVVIGAAIYASTQQIPRALRAVPGWRSGELSAELSYEPMTNNPQPVLAGQLLGSLGDGRWRVEVVSETSGFASAPAAVQENGAFAVRLQLAEGVLNAFTLTAAREGDIHPALTSRFSIIHGTAIAKPVLSQSLGVVLSDNTVRWYLRKGMVLPARQTVSHATTLALTRGQQGYAVHVPLIQGESEHGDRNTIVGEIRIQAEKLTSDLPAGSEVLVTIGVDEHSTTSAQAHVPFLNQTFGEIVKFGLETRESGDIRRGLESQRDRLKELEKLAGELQDGASADISGRVQAIEELLDDCGADERNQADQLLHAVTRMLDSVESKDRKTSLTNEFLASERQIRALLTKEDTTRRQQIDALSAEFEAALSRDDLDLAAIKCKAAKGLEWALIGEQPGYWVGLFNYLCNTLLQGPRAAEARVSIDDGKVAVERQNWNDLVRICREMIKLLPEQQKAALPQAIVSHVS